MRDGKRTYKQRFLLLCGASMALLICAYFLSVKKTLALRSEYQALLQKSKNAQSIHQDLQKWKSLNHSMDDQLGGSAVFTGFQESLLGTVGRFCEDNDLRFTDFSEPFEGSEGGYRIETIILTVQGSYKPLLRLVHHLETQFKGGRIASVEFNREKNFRSNRDELFLRLYIQNVKTDEKQDE